MSTKFYEFYALFFLNAVCVCNFKGVRETAKKLPNKCWSNWLQVLISSTFHEHLLRSKFKEKLICTFSLCLYYRGMEICQICVSKMLVKLTTAVNGTMSADIFKHKMLDGTCNSVKMDDFSLKMGCFFVLKLCPIFPRKQPLQIASKTW